MQDGRIAARKKGKFQNGPWACFGDMTYQTSTLYLFFITQIGICQDYGRQFTEGDIIGPLYRTFKKTSQEFTCLEGGGFPVFRRPL